MLHEIWDQQKNYNRKIFKLEGGDEPHRWSQQYLLGIADQISEVLKEIKWKRHRRENGKKIVRLNVLEEIADIVKYAISLAQIWGFSEQDLLDAMYEKGEILDFRLNMEFIEPPVGQKILITDVDGTLADYQSSFLQWLQRGGVMHASEITSLSMDNSLEITYPEYYAMKEHYEEVGGYRDLLPYSDTAEALQEKKRQGYRIIVTTARPSHVYKRIFKDTLYWFNKHGFPIDELHMMGSGRVILACDLGKENDVILWEDDPDILARASKSSVRTYARRQSYNQNLCLPNVTIVDSYAQEDQNE